MGVFTIHVYLGEDRKVWFITTPWSDMLEGTENLHLSRIFLVTELVAREGQHLQMAGESLNELIQLGVVPRRRPSQRCSIFYQNHFTHVV